MKLSRMLPMWQQSLKSDMQSDQAKIGVMSLVGWGERELLLIPSASTWVLRESLQMRLRVALKNDCRLAQGVIGQDLERVFVDLVTTVTVTVTVGELEVVQTSEAVEETSES